VGSSAEKNGVIRKAKRLSKRRQRTPGSSGRQEDFQVKRGKKGYVPLRTKRGTGEGRVLPQDRNAYPSWARVRKRVKNLRPVNGLGRVVEK